MHRLIGSVLCVLVLALISSLSPGVSGLAPEHFLATAQATTPPVILELFTSEGCSSCPPADALLKKLDDAGRLDDVEIIAIEEHVDYWNRLGWTDPFSSPDWTRRQERYSEAFRRGGIYTPQLVVNGRAELVGSSERQVRQEILEAGKITAATVRISSIIHHHLHSPSLPYPVSQCTGNPPLFTHPFLPSPRLLFLCYLVYNTLLLFSEDSFLAVRQHSFFDLPAQL